MSDAVTVSNLPPAVSALNELGGTPRQGIAFAPVEKSGQPRMGAPCDAGVRSTYQLRLRESGVSSWKPLRDLATSLWARNPYYLGVSVTPSSIGKLKLREELSSYTKLAQNWDGEGASPPTQAAVDDALAFLDNKPADIPWPFPEEGTDGDVGVYWDYIDESVFAEVMFEGNGTYAYFAVYGVPSAVIEKFSDSGMDVNSAWPDEMLRILRIRTSD